MRVSIVKPSSRASEVRLSLSDVAPKAKPRTFADSKALKIIVEPKVRFCGQPRVLKVLFSGNLRPTRRNLLVVFSQVLKTASNKASKVVLALYSKSVPSDPRTRWLKKYRGKLLDALVSHKSVKSRRWIVSVLFQNALRLKSKEVESALLKALLDTSPNIRKLAAHALRRMRDLTPRTLSKLSKYLKSRNRHLRALSLNVLSYVGNVPNSAEHILIRLAKDKSNKDRLFAVKALGNLKYKSTRSEKALVHVLKNDPHPAVQSCVLRALSERGVRSSRVVRAIKWYLKRARLLADNKAAAFAAMGNLGKVSSSTAKKFVIPGLASTFPQVRAAALYALSQAPLHIMSKVLGFVVGFLNSRFADVRVNALYILNIVKPQDVSIVRKILPKLNDSQWRVRVNAAYVLSGIGRIAKPYAVRALQRRLRRERNPGVKRQFKEALKFFAGFKKKQVRKRERTPKPDSRRKLRTYATPIPRRANKQLARQRMLVASVRAVYKGSSGSDAKRVLKTLKWSTLRQLGIASRIIKGFQELEDMKNVKAERIVIEAQRLVKETLKNWTSAN